MAIPAAYGSSQARGPIGAAAASLCHSHSNAESEPRLWPNLSSRQRQILNPLSEARDWTWNLMVPSWIHFCWATTGTPTFFWYLYSHFSYFMIIQFLWCIFSIHLLSAYRCMYSWPLNGVGVTSMVHLYVDVFFNRYCIPTRELWSMDAGPQMMMANHSYTWIFDWVVVVRTVLQSQP